MRRFSMLVGLLIVAMLPGAAVWAQQGANAEATQKAVAYIRTQQAADGTFAGFGPSSTADAIYALVSAGVNPAETRNGQASAVDGLVKLAPEAARETGVAAKFVIAALLSGQSPRSLGGTDLVGVVERSFNAATGQYGKDVSSHALALLALKSAGGTIPPEAIAALEKLQLQDGGWSFDGAAATGSDTNTTALAIQSLVAAGGTTAARDRAVAYLRAQQNADAGFPYSQTSQFGNASDANSTALAIQAILATGDVLTNWAKNGKTPADRLIAFQNTSGAFRYQDAQPADNQLASYQAIPALAGQTFPFEPLLIAQPAPAAQVAGTATPTPALTATVPVTTTVQVPLTTTATLTMTTTPAAGGGSGTITPTALPTAVAGATGPIRMPDTGSRNIPVLPVIVAGLAAAAAGIAIRRRSA